MKIKISQPPDTWYPVVEMLNKWKRRECSKFRKQRSRVAEDDPLYEASKAAEAAVKLVARDITNFTDIPDDANGLGAAGKARLTDWILNTSLSSDDLEVVRASILLCSYGRGGSGVGLVSLEAVDDDPLAKSMVRHEYLMWQDNLQDSTSEVKGLLSNYMEINPEVEPDLTNEGNKPDEDLGDSDTDSEH